MTLSPPRPDDEVVGPLADTRLARAIEHLLSAGIGITARAIGDSPDASTLTLAQWRVLVIACRTDGLRVGELAAHLGTSVPSASRLVRRIEARQLLTAVRARDDRRATIVSPTEAGRALVRDVVARRQHLIDMALRDQAQRRNPDAAVLIDGIAAGLAEFA